MRYGYIRLCPDLCSDEKTKQFLCYKKILQTKKINSIRTDIAFYNEALPELEQLLNQDLNSGDILYVAEFRQISRSIQFFLNLQEFLYKKDIDLIILDLVNPTTNTSKELLKQFQRLLSKLSKLEKEQRLRRQKRAINIAKSKGQKVGRPPIANKDKIDEISILYNNGTKVSEISKKIDLSETTVYRVLNFLKGNLD